MKKIILSLAFIGYLAPTIYSAQTVQIAKTPTGEKKVSLPKPYNEKEDGEKAITKLLKKAKTENKLLFIQAGGNWCGWCLKFNHLVNTTPELKNLVDENFIYYHLNYSPKNKNERAFSKYAKNGKELGYPFFIVLDKNGKVLGVHESANLEENKGYNLEKVIAFFKSLLPS